MLKVRDDATKLYVNAKVTLKLSGRNRVRCGGGV
jgi:hypothetical protein